MGIRFFCPRGHKLNVKAELAGKVGICPKCGERMLIPLESTREPGQKRSSLKDGQKWGDSSDQQASDESGDLFKDVKDNNQDGVQVISPSQKVTITDMGKLDSPEELLKKKLQSIPIYEPGTPVGTTISVRNMDPIVMKEGHARPVSEYAPIIDDRHRSSFSSDLDLSQEQDRSQSPLDLYPDAEWIICGSDNRNYGPSKSATIKKWIEDQRIGPDTPVRHKDWPEGQWSKAQDVFPELAPVKKKESFSVNQNGFSSNEMQVDPEDPEVISIERQQINRKKKARRDLVIVLVLILLIAVLIGVLCFILLGQKKTKNGKTPAPAPVPVQTSEKAAAKPVERPKEPSVSEPVEKTERKDTEKQIEKTERKPVEKQSEKPADKPDNKSTEKSDS